MRCNYEKKKYKQPEIVSFFQTKIWKVTITIVSGITAVLVLFATISAILRPYYEIQRDIDKILTHIETQTEQQETNAQEIKLVEEDIAILVRTLHTLLRIEAGETVSKSELNELLEYFEENIVYEKLGTGKEPEGGEEDAQSAIGKITQETLEALRKLQ